MTAPSPFSIESVVATHSEEIKQLALSTQSLIEIAKNSEKQRIDDVAVMKDLAHGINTLNEKLNGALSLSGDMSQVKEDLRVVKHDLMKYEQAIAGIDTLNDKASSLSNRSTALETRLSQVEKIIDQATGGLRVAKSGVSAIWAVFGAGAVALIGFVMYLFFSLPHPKL